MSITTAINSMKNHVEDIYETLELGKENPISTNKNINNIYTNIINNYEEYLANGTDVI